jgi:hypothetical protein
MQLFMKEKSKKVKKRQKVKIGKIKRCEFIE